MEIYERIKLLRKNELKKTQEEFSEKINISRSNLGSIEVGRINVTDRVVNDICTAYGVNKNWLLYGNEPIFEVSDHDIAAQIATRFGADDMDAKIIEAYLRLPDEYREAIKHFAINLADNLSPDDGKVDK